MTSPTNLTDEGLREIAREISKEIRFSVTSRSAYTTVEQVGNPEDKIFNALKQVRDAATDAAKKEERERCAEIAKRFNYWNNLTGRDAQELTAFRIAAYIREQE